LKHTQIPNFVKTRPVGADMFHADGRTDRHMTKLRVASRNFVNAPNKNKIRRKHHRTTNSENDI